MTTDVEARLAALEARLRTFEDKEAIRDVLYRYARGADRCDEALFRSCYWPDATDLHWFYNGNAHEFAAWVIPLLAKITNSQHSITNPIIDLDGDRAFVECQWYVIHRIPLDGERVIDQQAEGRYLDVFHKRDGEWRIFHRQTALEAMREVVSVDLAAGRDPVTLGRRGEADAVYRGFAITETPYAPVRGGDLWAAARARHGG